MLIHLRQCFLVTVTKYSVIKQNWVKRCSDVNCYWLVVLLANCCVSILQIKTIQKDLALIGDAQSISRHDFLLSFSVSIV